MVVVILAQRTVIRKSVVLAQDLARERAFVVSLTCVSCDPRYQADSSVLHSRRRGEGVRMGSPRVPLALSTLTLLSAACSLLFKNTHGVSSKGSILFNYFPACLQQCCCQGNQTFEKLFRLRSERTLVRRLCYLWAWSVFL